MRTLAFVVPGSLATRTGGYRYDDRIIAALRSRGWLISVHELPGSYPTPDPQAFNYAASLLEAFPDGAVVVIDGLALGALPTLATEQRQRLQLIALIHHPLALETGLDAKTIETLHTSEKTALQAVCGIIVTSEATAGLLHPYEVADSLVHVVEPGTDDPAASPLGLPNRPAPNRPAPNAVDRTLTLLCVASLTPRKGHAVLIEALAPWRNLNWKLLCAGNAQRNPDLVLALRQQVIDLGLIEQVVLTGELDDKAIVKHYQQADAFVFASHFEGYGMVFNEALVHGLPVISTRVGAVESAVPANARSVVEPGDVAGLSAALGRFLNEPAWREEMKRNANRDAGRCRSWEHAGADFDHALSALTT